MERRIKKSNRPTQSDVARLAGVSVPVVSAVLNSSKGTVRVGPDVTERVQRIIEEIGYVPNPIARSLVNAKRNILGVFTFDASFPSRREDFFYPFLQGIEGEVEGSGFDLLLFTAAPLKTTQRSLFPNGANRLSVSDGAVVLGEKQNREELARLAEDGFPFVVIGRRDVPGVQLNYVAASYAAATEKIVERAWKLGHRRFCYIGGLGDDERQLDRREGFMAGLARHGVAGDDLILIVGPDGDRVAQSIAHIRRLDATIVITEEPDVAEALDRALPEAGLRVPDDISLCTLTHPSSEYGRHRQFTRLIIPREEMGAEAVRMLLRLLENPGAAPLTTSLDCDFAEGTTLAPPR